MLSIPRDVFGVEFGLVDADPVQLPDCKTVFGKGDAGGLAVLELLASDPAAGGTAPQAAKIRRPRTSIGTKSRILKTKRGSWLTVTDRMVLVN